MNKPDDSHESYAAIARTAIEMIDELVKNEKEEPNRSMGETWLAMLRTRMEKLEENHDEG